MSDSVFLSDTPFGTESGESYFNSESQPYSSVGFDQVPGEASFPFLDTYIPELKFINQERKQLNALEQKGDANPDYIQGRKEVLDERATKVRELAELRRLAPKIMKTFTPRQQQDAIEIAQKHDMRQSEFHKMVYDMYLRRIQNETNNRAHGLSLLPVVLPKMSKAVEGKGLKLAKKYGLLGGPGHGMYQGGDYVGGDYVGGDYVGGYPVGGTYVGGDMVGGAKRKGPKKGVIPAGFKKFLAFKEKFMKKYPMASRKEVSVAYQRHKLSL